MKEPKEEPTHFDLGLLSDEGRRKGSVVHFNKCGYGRIQDDVDNTYSTFIFKDIEDALCRNPNSVFGAVVSYERTGDYHAKKVRIEKEASASEQLWLVISSYF